MSARWDEVGTLKGKHCTLDYFMREVLPDVNVFGPFSSTNDVLPPLAARGVVIEDQSGLLLGKALLKPKLSSKNWRYKTSIAAGSAV
jgi:hypothetical protein